MNSVRDIERCLPIGNNLSLLQETSKLPPSSSWFAALGVLPAMRTTTSGMCFEVDDWEVLELDGYQLCLLHLPRARATQRHLQLPDPVRKSEQPILISPKPSPVRSNPITLSSYYIDLARI